MSWRGLWRDIRQETLSLPFPRSRLVTAVIFLPFLLRTSITFRYGPISTMASFRNFFVRLSRNLSSALLPNPLPDQTAMHFVLTLKKTAGIDLSGGNTRRIATE